MMGLIFCFVCSAAVIWFGRRLTALAARNAGCIVTFGGAAIFSLPHAWSQQQVLQEQLSHLRASGPPEWAEFAETPNAQHLELDFEASRNDQPWTLSLRQQDVKQRWQVKLGDQLLGRLPTDENDMRVYFDIPAGALSDGANRLLIEQQRPEPPDDVHVGEIVLHQQPRAQLLSEATLDVRVVDSKSGEPTPARITILDCHGVLQSVGAESSETLAVRPGTVYTADGRAAFGLLRGSYTILAGRGPEYSLAEQSVELQSGQHAAIELAIERQVSLADYVACDTHIHTLTHSGHGDATIQERVITIAGEGIELPIATDHNVHVDLDPIARQLNVRQYFTPVIGNEVTTSVGHFNIFPVAAGADPPDHRLTSWPEIFAAIYRTPGVKAVILNHGRDLHSGVRPLGRELHLAAVGENVQQWQLRAGAMEIINSGATQTDQLQLAQDWMTLLNRGHLLTPVGASDSHDVSRHFVGQGRTYVRASSADPANIDTDQAVNNFLQGRVLVSYGLMAEMTVGGKYHCGDLVPVFDESVGVAVRVLGADWIEADTVALYINGRLHEERPIPAEARRRGGVKWETTWQLPRPMHDVHLVAIASGPGVDGLHWKTAKPYQPTSPRWQPRSWGCSGAVWLDGDGDGRRTPAYQYAQLAVQGSCGDFANLLERLAAYDAATAAQAAMLHHQQGGQLLELEIQNQLRQAEPHVQAGFAAYITSWRQTQAAREAAH